MYIVFTLTSKYENLKSKKLIEQLKNRTSLGIVTHPSKIHK